MYRAHVYESVRQFFTQVSSSNIQPGTSLTLLHPAWGTPLRRSSIRSEKAQLRTSRSFSVATARLASSELRKLTNAYMRPERDSTAGEQAREAVDQHCMHQIKHMCRSARTTWCQEDLKGNGTMCGCVELVFMPEGFKDDLVKPLAGPSFQGAQACPRRNPRGTACN
eukprot:1159892-Pelagomonas_calceolata.AAC.9